MYKLVVLFSVVAVAVAKPSAWAAPVAYSAVYAAPAAVSHQSRVDVHSSPAHFYSAPVAVVSPYHSVAHAPLSLAPHTPAVVLNAHGVPLDTSDVVAARAIHYQAKALAGHGVHYLKKRSLVSPFAYSAVVAPAAVSHQSRVDVHTSPVISHVAPIVSHYAAAPIAYSSPIAYASPYAYSSPYSYSGHVYGAQAYGIHPW